MRRGILRNVRRDDGGYVLPMVMGAGVVLVALVGMTLAVTLSGLVKATTDTHWTAALAAAYAGMEDYKSRLENDIAYVRYGNEDSPFSAGSSLVVPTGADANPAFNTEANQPWAVVPGTDGKSQFRYEVNNSDFSGTGVIRIRATGKVGDSTRSVVADLLQNGFTDYVYFTGYETSDPILTTASDDNCKAYAWVRPTSCAEIRFATGDVLHGKVHSNDRIYLDCGAVFEKDVTTGYNTPPYYKIASGTTETQQFTTATGVQNATACKKTQTVPGGPGQYTFQGKAPHPVNPINIGDPRVMLQEMRYDIPDKVPDPGCLYTGPTTIKLTNNGKMTVWSPFTKVTQIKGPNAEPWKPTEGRQGLSPSGAANYCGSPADLQSVNGATINVPTNNAVYVQNVPNDSTNPNYTAAPTGTGPWTFTPPSASGTRFKCSWNSGTTFSDARSQQAWSLTNSSGTVVKAVSSENNSMVKHPIDNEAFPATSVDGNPAYGCRKGDLYIVGGSVLDGRLTLAAENAAYIMGDVTLKDRTLGSDDMLGIIGTGSVWIANPINSSNANIYTAPTTGRQIDASLLSAQHTVIVQNWDKGGLTGQLHIKGSIAQLFRGPVGTGSPPSTGYLKDYQYDSRLTYASPPKYLMPTSTVFGISQIEGSGAAYGPNGAPR